ncbi:hypothetical protein L6164_002925 [Bauhinia variegata]|uniref:Uncharacterized protein n=1 Tax=Bauhinia variegata TaxID=167791 RepID=A0ACB9Q176_BAUVA|nr:hypothetical protein L6164_002925 [Bauhinia variegata]
MEDILENGLTSIMHLPDDCLVFIFQCLSSSLDRESFGLTCHRWLQIQNLNRRSLQFQCSFTLLNPSTLYTNSFDIHPLYLHRLLDRFQHLESLSLSGCTDLTDSGLTQLRFYGSNLQTLNLDCCLSITDNGLFLVASGCPSLEVISLYRCLSISDIGLEILGNACSSLKDVNLSYCSQISDRGLQALTQQCHQLQAVKISHCVGITGVGFRGCSKTLCYVEAEYCKFNPEGVMGIVSGGGMQYLNVSCLSWSPLGDPLGAIGMGCSSSLKILNLRMCRTISDASIVAIAKGCPLLQEWNLALCHEVRLSGWEAISSNCHNLQKLHVNRCRNLCDRGLQVIRDGCKRLSILYLSGCFQISSIAIELFKCYRADIQIIGKEVMCIAPNWEFR